MYGEDNTEVNKLIKLREAFFKKYKYHCTCYPRFSVCKNCNGYYSIFGRIWMVIKSRRGWGKQWPADYEIEN